MKITVAGQTDLHVFLSLVNKALWFNRPGSNYIGENPNVKQPSSLKLIWDRLTEEGRGADTREMLGRGKKPTYAVSKPSIWHQPHQYGHPRSLSPTFSWWLNAIYMHSATTKALLLQIAHCDRHVFLVQPWEDNHYSSQKNVQKLTHTSSKGFYPRDVKILQFLWQALPMKRKKKISAVKFTTGKVFQ